MTTHTIITVDLDQPTNRAALGARFRAYIARDTDSDLDWLISGGDGELHLDCIRNGDKDAQATTLRFWVNTKYSLESSEKVAQSMSGAYPTATVQWSESWDDEVTVEEQKGFAAGELVVERAAQIVPKDLDALVKELEACVGDGSRAVAVEPALRAARALVKAYRA